MEFAAVFRWSLNISFLPQIKQSPNTILSSTEGADTKLNTNSFKKEREKKICNGIRSPNSKNWRRPFWRAVQSDYAPKFCLCHICHCRSFPRWTGLSFLNSLLFVVVIWCLNFLRLVGVVDSKSEEIIGKNEFSPYFHYVFVALY